MRAVPQKKYTNLTAHMTFPREVRGVYFILRSVLGTQVVCLKEVGQLPLKDIITRAETILSSWSAGIRFLYQFRS